MKWFFGLPMGWMLAFGLSTILAAGISAYYLAPQVAKLNEHDLLFLILISIWIRR